MARAERKEKKFITAEEFVSNLRRFLRVADDTDTLSVSEIRENLDRVLIPGEPDERQLRAAALDRIKEHSKNNPNEENGIASGSVWRDIVTAGLSCSLESIEEAIISLVDAGEVTLIAGQLTTLRAADTEEEKNKS